MAFLITVAMTHVSKLWKGHRPALPLHFSMHAPGFSSPAVQLSPGGSGFNI